MFLNIFKGTYDKPTAIIILNSENMKTFTLKLRSQLFLLSHLLLNIVPEVLARAIRQEKEKKKTSILGILDN